MFGVFKRKKTTAPEVTMEEDDRDVSSPDDVIAGKVKELEQYFNQNPDAGRVISEDNVMYMAFSEQKLIDFKNRTIAGEDGTSEDPLEWDLKEEARRLVGEIKWVTTPRKKQKPEQYASPTGSHQGCTSCQS